MLDIYTIGLVGLAALAAWVLFRRQRQTARAAPVAGSRWKYVPLASAVILWTVTFLTFGAGVLLAPAGLVLTFVAARRTAPGRDVAFWLGAVLNMFLGILFVLTLAIFVNDNWIA